MRRVGHWMNYRLIICITARDGAFSLCSRRSQLSRFPGGGVGVILRSRRSRPPPRKDNVKLITSKVGRPNSRGTHSGSAQAEARTFENADADLLGGGLKFQVPMLMPVIPTIWDRETQAAWTKQIYDGRAMGIEFIGPIESHPLSGAAVGVPGGPQGGAAGPHPPPDQYRAGLRTRLPAHRTPPPRARCPKAHNNGRTDELANHPRPRLGDLANNPTSAPDLPLC